jgi:hypothetical protein
MRPEDLAEERVTPSNVERIPAVILEVRHLPITHLERQA